MTAFKTVRAHPEIIRRVGLGAQQCTECGTVYMDTEIPESCDSGECPTNRPASIGSEQMDVESELCAWAKHLIKMGITAESIHGQVDNAIAEAYEEQELAKLFE